MVIGSPGTFPPPKKYPIWLPAAIMAGYLCIRAGTPPHTRLRLLDRSHHAVLDLHLEHSIFASISEGPLSSPSDRQGGRAKPANQFIVSEAWLDSAWILPVHYRGWRSLGGSCPGLGRRLRRDHRCRLLIRTLLSTLECFVQAPGQAAHRLANSPGRCGCCYRPCRAQAALHGRLPGRPAGHREPQRK
jgi:hypothetical protein